MKRKKDRTPPELPKEPEREEEPMLSESLELDDILQDFRETPGQEEVPAAPAETQEEAGQDTIRLNREALREQLREAPPPAEKQKKRRERKKKKKVGYNSLGMIAIALVVLVLLGGLMLESNDLKERLTGYDAKAATLQQQIEDEQTRTEEIDKLKKYMETDEYAEEVAREKLGLVKDNETVFKKQQ